MSSSEGRSAVRTISVLLAALALAAPARATTVEPLTFSEVVNGADVIAVGAVSAIAETWDAEREMAPDRGHHLRPRGSEGGGGGTGADPAGSSAAPPRKG